MYILTIIQNMIAGITVGNCLPLGQMPEGTVVCQVEEQRGDRGKIAKASGIYQNILY